MRKSPSLAVWCAFVAVVLAGSVERAPKAQSGVTVPQFKADAYWPKPLPQERDSEGQLRRWVTGQVGAVCIDAHDHIFTVNRLGMMGRYEGMSGMPAPEVVVYNTAGDVINSWGKRKEGEPKVLSETAHGCTVDYDNNVWLTGNADGIAQKWSHDGKTLLLQIGEKGKCDGDASRNPNPQARFPTCGEGIDLNSSKTLLNGPANLWVDSGADGYGNHRVVVFDSKGKYLRQWGSAGDGPGQFAKMGGGHPHCVALSKDGFLYACDRGNNRIFEFDKVGNLKRTIPINPEGGMVAPQRTADVAFSNDPQQTYMYTTDLGNNVIRILDRKSGKIVGTIGVGPGRGVGELLTPHQLAVDSRGNLYVSSTIDSNRVQRFLMQ
jgi:NHL repeat-containing protein